jgi:DNA-binding NarL/FixJ family response regulator
MTRALELHRGLDIPLDRAEIALRAAAALDAAGERRAALEALQEAHRTARRLGARPVVVEAARAGAALGQPLGRRGAADAEGGGLSRRELEVVRLVAAGGTNREIATALVLSPRTVNMHVRNLLRKLDSRSRVDAVRWAGELGLLV